MNKGIPVFISECSPMEATGNGNLYIAEWNRWLEWMEEHKTRI